MQSSAVEVPRIRSLMAFERRTSRNVTIVIATRITPAIMAKRMSARAPVAIQAPTSPMLHAALHSPRPRRGRSRAPPRKALAHVIVGNELARDEESLPFACRDGQAFLRFGYCG